MQKGMQKGMQKAIVGLLKNGADVDFIAKALEVPGEEVERIGK